jgi:protein TonB
MDVQRTDLPRRIVELPRRSRRRRRWSSIGIRVVQWVRATGIASFARWRLDPRRHVVAFASVVLVHVLVIWALISGLAKKTVEVVYAPVETKVISEPRKVPAEIAAPPPPKLEAPPLPFIPPPEVEIAAAPPEPAITAAATPPPAPVPASAAPAPAPPARPPAVSAGTACSKIVNPHAPLVADSTGVSGASVEYRAVMQGGTLTSFEITRLQLRGGNDAKVKQALQASVEAAVRQYVCANDVPFFQEIEFRFTE